jgi:hypothetical protein
MLVRAVLAFLFLCLFFSAAWRRQKDQENIIKKYVHSLVETEFSRYNKKKQEEMKKIYFN